MSKDAKQIVAEIEPHAKEIRELLNKLCTVKEMTSEQYEAWAIAKRGFNEWLFIGLAA